MKKLLIAFLLAIFSIQGAVAAIGSDIALPARGDEVNGSAAACSFSEGFSEGCTADDEGLSVALSIEELSDYVPFNLPASSPGYRVAVPVSQPIIFFSTDLPRITPPPRS